jgi:polyphosphate kinase
VNRRGCPPISGTRCCRCYAVCDRRLTAVPLLASLSLNLALLLEPEATDGEPRLAVVQVPPGLPRLVRLSESSGTAFVVLDDVIREHLTQLFPGQAIREIACFRLSRDAELELDDEGGERSSNWWNAKFAAAAAVTPCGSRSRTPRRRS